MTHTDGWVAPMDDDPFHDLIYSDPELVRVDFDEIVSAAREPVERQAISDENNADATSARPANLSHLGGADGEGLTRR